MDPDTAALRSLVEQASDTILLLDADGMIVYANPAAEDLFGRPHSELIGESFGSVATSEQQSEFYIPHPRQGLVATNVRRTTIALADIPYTAIYLRDVTERVEADERLRQSAVAFDSINEGIMITKPDNTIIAVNRAFTEITGYTHKEILGRTPRFFQSEDHDEDFYEEMQRVLVRQGHWIGDVWNCRKNGETYLQWLSINPVWGENGQLLYYVGVFSDMTSINELRRLAHHDPLTGLYNRAAFQQYLDEELHRTKRYGRSFSLIMFDLDHFKAINDRYGHDVGDQVLQQVAGLVSDELRDTDSLSRWGGEEFILLLPETGADHAEVLARRLQERFAATHFTGVGNVTISMGIADSQPDECQRELLIRVDSALYQAKQGGRNRWVKSACQDAHFGNGSPEPDPRPVS